MAFVAADRPHAFVAGLAATPQPALIELAVGADGVEVGIISTEPSTAMGCDSDGDPPLARLDKSLYWLQRGPGCADPGAIVRLNEGVTETLSSTETARFGPVAATDALTWSNAAGALSLLPVGASTPTQPFGSAPRGRPLAIDDLDRLVVLSDGLLLRSSRALAQLDGSDFDVITETPAPLDAARIVARGQAVYFAQGSELLRAELDGSREDTLLSSPHAIVALHATEQWLYVLREDGLLRLPLFGHEP